MMEPLTVIDTARTLRAAIAALMRDGHTRHRTQIARALPHFHPLYVDTTLGRMVRDGMLVRGRRGWYRRAGP